jgi:hypothetical protein
MTSTPEHPEQSPADDFVPTEELVRRQGVKPITSVDDLAQPVWVPETARTARDLLVRPR